MLLAYILFQFLKDGCRRIGVAKNVNEMQTSVQEMSSFMQKISENNNFSVNMSNLLATDEMNKFESK